MFSPIIILQETEMKKIISLAVFIVLTVFWGCSKDDSNPVSGPVDVTFRMSHIASGDTVYFQFKASQDIKLDSITSSCTVKSFTDVYSVGEPNRVFNKEVLYQWIGYYGVTQGQKWSFTFKGRLASSNASFTYSTSYIVP